MSYILHILEGLKWALMLPWAAIQRLFRDDKATSPIIAILLLVAITLLLALAVYWTLSMDMSGLQETAKTVYSVP